MQGSTACPVVELLARCRARRSDLLIAFSASCICLPGDIARWVAQSMYAAISAAGDRPPVNRANAACSDRSMTSPTTDAGSNSGMEAHWRTSAPASTGNRTGSGFAIEFAEARTFIAGVPSIAWRNESIVDPVRLLLDLADDCPADAAPDYTQCRAWRPCVLHNLLATASAISARTSSGSVPTAVINAPSARRVA